MSSATQAEVEAAVDQGSLAAVIGARWEAFKGGDVGFVPVLVGIVAITITPAAWPIRFWKLIALKNRLFFEVKNSVIAMIPMITGRLPTSPDLIASQRARAIPIRPSCSSATDWISAGAAELKPRPPPEREHRR